MDWFMSTTTQIHRIFNIKLDKVLNWHSVKTQLSKLERMVLDDNQNFIINKVKFNRDKIWIQTPQHKIGEIKFHIFHTSYIKLAWYRLQTNYWGPKELLRIFEKFPVKPKVSIDIKPQRFVKSYIYKATTHTQIKGMGGNSER